MLASFKKSDDEDVSEIFSIKKVSLVELIDFHHSLLTPPWV
jgi:hypothetical protein